MNTTNNMLETKYMCNRFAGNSFAIRWPSILAIVSASLCMPLSAACIDDFPQTTPISYFALQQDTVYDESTGLLWQRCAVGQKWNNKSKQCSLIPDSIFNFTWLEAQKIPAGLTEQGWRIPSKIELLSIVERACTGPAINEQVFPDTPYQGFWSVDTPRALPDHQWVVNFKTGSLETLQNDLRLSVRLVKAKQP